GQGPPLGGEGVAAVHDQPAEGKQGEEDEKEEGGDLPPLVAPHHAPPRCTSIGATNRPVRVFENGRPVSTVSPRPTVQSTSTPTCPPAVKSVSASKLTFSPWHRIPRSESVAVAASWAA